MSPEKKYLIGEILKDKGLITEEQLENALSDQRASGKLLGKILVDKGFVSEADILSVLSAQLGMKEINLSQIKISKDLLDRVPSSIAKAYKIVPIRMESNTLVVAMGDPMNVQILDDLRFMLDCEVKGLRSNEEV